MDFTFEINEELLEMVLNDGYTREFLVDPKNWEFCDYSDGYLEIDEDEDPVPALQPSLWLQPKNDTKFACEVPFSFGGDTNNPMENEVACTNIREFKQHLKNLGMAENPNIETL